MERTERLAAHHFRSSSDQFEEVSQTFVFTIKELCGKLVSHIVPQLLACCGGVVNYIKFTLVAILIQSCLLSRFQSWY
jgi:hypothetical protein